MGKTIQKLPKRVRPWIDRHFEERKSNSYNDTFDNMINHLIVEDSKLQARWLENNPKKDKGKTSDTDNKKTKTNKVCMGCKKLGHAYDNCF